MHTNGQHTVTPTDGMVLMASTTFVPGVYSLPHGVVIGADAVELNMTGSTLVGDNGPSSFGLQIQARHGVRVTGGTARGYMPTKIVVLLIVNYFTTNFSPTIYGSYFYGVRAEHSAGLILEDMDVSGNWVDPKSLGPVDSVPWLDINCPANLSDTTNLGGGVFLNNCTAATVRGVRACDQENGVNAFSCEGLQLVGNTATNNTGIKLLGWPIQN